MIGDLGVNMLHQKLETLSSYGAKTINIVCYTKFENISEEDKTNSIDTTQHRHARVPQPTPPPGNVF